MEDGEEGECVDVAPAEAPRPPSRTPLLEVPLPSFSSSAYHQESISVALPSAGQRQPQFGAPVPLVSARVDRRATASRPILTGPGSPLPRPSPLLGSGPGSLDRRAWLSAPPEPDRRWAPVLPTPSSASDRRAGPILDARDVGKAAGTPATALLGAGPLLPAPVPEARKVVPVEPAPPPPVDPYVEQKAVAVAAARLAYSMMQLGVATR
jgi:hypothetical protein